MIKTLAIILCSTAATGLTAWSMGALALRACKLTLHRQERRLFELLLGLPLLSLLVFALASVHAVYRGVFLAVAVVAIGTAFALRLHRTAGPSFEPLPRATRWVFWAAFAAFAFVYLIHGMKPEISPDGASYHLGHVARYYRAHGFVPTPGDMYGMLSQGVELLFLFAFAYGRHSAAALVHTIFLFALPALMVCYAKRRGMANAGAAAAILVFACPIIGLDGTSAYNDIALACCLFAMFYALEVWDETRETPLLVVAGALAGFGYGIKYVAFLAVPFAMGYVLWRARRNWRAVLLVALCAGVFIVPWLARNAIYYQNPFAPFANSVFPNPYQDAGFERIYRGMMQNYPGLKSYTEIPRQVLVRGDVLQGLIGPLFALLPLGLLALRIGTGRRLLLAALLFALPYSQNVGTRFLIPALPFAALAMCIPLMRVPFALPALIALHAVLSWPTVVERYSSKWAFRMDGIPVKAALRIANEEEFLLGSPSYRAARYLERHVPAGERVFTLTQVAEAYTTRDVLSGYQSVDARTLTDILWAAALPGMRPQWMNVYSFPERPLAAIRLVQTATAKDDPWGIAELYPVRAGKPLARSSEWRMTARPNPWQAPFAMDNNAATRWTSQVAHDAGMFYELRFNAPQTIDAVWMLPLPVAATSKVQLEGETSPGHWEKLSGPVDAVEIRQPRQLRRMAAQAMLGFGVRYFLVQPDDYGRDDFFKNREEWGFDLVWDDNANTRIYRVREAGK